MISRRVTLSEIGTWGSGGTPTSTNREYYNGNITWLIIEDLNDQTVFSSKNSITEAGLRNSSAKLVPAGTLLIAMYGSIGKLGIAGIPCCTNQAIAHCKCDSNIAIPKFVFYYLLFHRQSLAGLGRGGTQSNISQEILKDFSINLPSLDTQKEIVNHLQRADRLRRKHQYALKLSDTFLQSVFLKMFGDPRTNPLGWDVSKLRGIATKFSDGPFGSNLKSEHYQPTGVRVIRLQNIGVGMLHDEDKAFISTQHFATLQQHRCLPGDVIVGTMGEPNLRAIILPDSIGEALNKADCVQIRPDVSKVNAEYICWLLNLPDTLYLASREILGQTRSRISMGRLAEITIPVPPLPQQEKFATIVKKFERLRAQQREALRQAEHLFQTLLHRAFNTETELLEVAPIAEQTALDL